MKTAVKIALSLISASVLTIIASWVCLGHSLGPKIITEQNVGLVMWSAAGITAVVIAALTVAFYRVVR